MFTQAYEDSNPGWRFWRPPCCRYTIDLRVGHDPGSFTEAARHDAAWLWPVFPAATHSMNLMLSNCYSHLVWAEAGNLPAGRAVLC